MYYISHSLFAQAYGTGNYNESTYQNSTVAGGTTSNTGVSTGNANGGGSAGTLGVGGGTLSNTGFDVLVVATLASVIMLAALAVRIWKRPARSS